MFRIKELILSTGRTAILPYGRWITDLNYRKTVMTKPQVYIDGSAGTTGLRIKECLTKRTDIEVKVLTKGERRDPEVRRQATQNADLTILCLPDDAAKEAAEWASASGTKIIDASTAHRINETWTYGLPEMTVDQRKKIESAQKVSNPGCYPTGMILSIRPLIENGLLRKDTPITIHALSGYTGGGKKLIAKWEKERPDLINLPFESPYALHTKHKHIPEMQKYSGLSHAPQFIPSVGPFPTGMRLEIPIHKAVLPEDVQYKEIWQVLNERYNQEEFIRVNTIKNAVAYNDPAFDPRATNNTNRCDISIIPNPLGHVMIIVQIDNLGKGAAGAAVQNMNIMLGQPENAGLTE